MLTDYRTAPLPEREKALLSFVEKVNRTAATVRPQDIDQLKATGWTEEAIYDAINVCCLFNFYNRWNDAAGTPDLSEEAYTASGKRLAAGGYR